MPVRAPLGTSAPKTPDPAAVVLDWCGGLEARKADLRLCGPGICPPSAILHDFGSTSTHPTQRRLIGVQFKFVERQDLLDSDTLTAPSTTWQFYLLQELLIATCDTFSLLTGWAAGAASILAVASQASSGLIFGSWVRAARFSIQPNQPWALEALLVVKAGAEDNPSNRRPLTTGGWFMGGSSYAAVLVHKGTGD